MAKEYFFRNQKVDDLEEYRSIEEIVCRIVDHQASNAKLTPDRVAEVLEMINGEVDIVDLLEEKINSAKKSLKKMPDNSRRNAHLRRLIKITERIETLREYTSDINFVENS